MRGRQQEVLHRFSGTGSVTLNAKPAKNWQDDIWTDDCAGGTSPPCMIPLDGTDHIVTANFTATSGVSQSTLNVTYDRTDGNGVTSRRRRRRRREPIDCGSTRRRPTARWTVLTGRR